VEIVRDEHRADRDYIRRKTIKFMMEHSDPYEKTTINEKKT
jgi:hypothetical protein